MTLSVFVGLCFALLLAVVGVTTFFLVRKPRTGFIILGVLLAVAAPAFVSWKPIYKTRTPRFAEEVKKVADRKSTRLNSSHTVISYAVFCLKKKKKTINSQTYKTYKSTHIHI